MSSSLLSELSYEVSYMTVDKLKALIRKLNEGLGSRMRLSGVKAELVQRIKDELQIAYTNGGNNRLDAAKLIINDVQANIERSPASSTSSNFGYAPTPAYSGASSSGYSSPYANHTPAVAPAYPYANHGLPQARFNNSGLAAAGMSSAHLTPQNTGELPIRFRPSPFYRPEKALSTYAQLVKAAQGDRKTSHCTFSLTEAQRQLLLASKTPSSPQWEVRLYCVSEDNFNITRPSSTQSPAPVDFPPVCEVRLNSVVVPANTKGIKKLPGSAPPVNLTAKINLATQGQLNKVEMIYAATEKRYFMVVYLVSVTTIKTIVDRVKAGKRKSKEQVIVDICKTNEDPDVEASALSVSLKDPVTFTRIKTPIRSTSCTHIACFDADIFFMMNESTPTWKCPHCSKILRVDDLLIDGYFEELLKACPESVESVQVEPDGTWRSSDNKFGTAPPKNPSNAVSTSNTPVPLPIMDKGKGRATEELTIDSDDEDVRPPKSNVISLGSTPDPTTRTGPAKRMATIDLTLSSDDEEEEEEEDDQGVAPIRKPPSPAKKRSRVESDDDDEQPRRSQFGHWM